MHGRLKIRTTTEEKARKKKEQELQVKAYRECMTKIFDKRENDEHDDDMLLLTSQILLRNADVYTLWNIRKDCLLNLQLALRDEDKQKMYNKDLAFTEQCLKVNSKSYGAWHHRYWVLGNSPNPDWDKEVLLCNNYLKMDERNFHCWDYRRSVVSKAGIKPDRELEFCTEKIKHNFSNYSSWHYRSKLLPLLYPHPTNPNRAISEEKCKEELDLVLTAAFTDPNDSSAWFYQRWLLGNCQPSFDLAALRISSKLIAISFTIPIDIRQIKFCSNIGLNLSSINWEPAKKGGNVDHVWFKADCFDLHLEDFMQFENCQITCIYADQKYVLDLMRYQSDFIGLKCPKFQYKFSEETVEELKTQLNLCNQLLEYEPDSKWTLLTASLLMRSIDSDYYNDISLQYLEKLQIVDNLRKGYYQDLASKWKIEQKIRNWTLTNDTAINISSNFLSTICYDYYFCIAGVIDVSHNNLTDNFLPKISSFIFCEKINLSNNLLNDVKNIPLLPRIRDVNIKNNNSPD